MCSPRPAVEAIQFALTLDEIEVQSFLVSWLHGEFVEIRENWPECPSAAFAGADIAAQFESSESSSWPA